MTRANPFPVYPVVRLEDEPKTLRERTIPTSSIRDARGLIGRYAQQWASDRMDSVREPLIVGVRGDYGSGKTHLLVDSISELQQGLLGIRQKATVLTVSFVETDPLTWYKSLVGSKVIDLGIQDTVVQLFSLAGKEVAAQSNLTKPAGKRLDRESTYVHELIRSDLLNASAVEARFLALLQETCSGTSQNVRNAIAGLVWAETANLSEEWLRGNQLPANQLQALRVLGPLASEGEAADILVAWAAIHNRLGLPLAFMFDELEHFARHDRVRSSKQNLTWLKRVLESIGALSPAVFVAGHFSAWEAESDVLDRLSQRKILDLLRMTGRDVELILRAGGAKSAGESNPRNSAVIAEAGSGNIRRILTICHFLHKESDGFNRAIDEAMIKKVAESSGQRATIEEAALMVHEMLEGLGCSVRKDEPLNGKGRFDLVAYRSGRPWVIAELKHAVTQSEQRRAAKQFLARLSAIQGSFSELIGLFVVDGSVDQEALNILRSHQKSPVLWLDLTQRSALSTIASDLKTRLGPGTGKQEDSSLLSELLAENKRLLGEIENARGIQDRELSTRLQSERETLIGQVEKLQERIQVREAQLEQRLIQLEEKRSLEMREFQSRIRELSQNLESTRDKSVLAPLDKNPGLDLPSMYEELKKGPSLFDIVRRSRVIRIMLPLNFLTVSALLVVSLSSSMFSPFQLLTYVISLVSILVFGMFMVWRSIMEFHAFFDVRGEVLRNLFLQRVSPGKFLSVAQELDRILRYDGPVAAKKRALDELETML